MMVWREMNHWLTMRVGCPKLVASPGQSGTWSGPEMPAEHVEYPALEIDVAAVFPLSTGRRNNVC